MSITCWLMSGHVIQAPGPQACVAHPPLVPLARALQQGQKTCQACLLSLSSPGMLIALLCSRPLLSHSLANCSMERMGSSNLQNLESSSVVYTEAGVSRVCVMELEVVNSADVGLQVRSGSRHGRLLST